MTTTINAQATAGLLTTADGSGIVKLQSNGVTTNALGWLNLNTSGSSAVIRSSYNISSTTYNATGYYTVNITTSPSDVNYCVVGSTGMTSGSYAGGILAINSFTSSPYTVAPTLSSFSFTLTYNNASFSYAQNATYIFLNIFGN